MTPSKPHNAATCVRCGGEFDGTTTYAGDRRPRGPARSFCSRRCKRRRRTVPADRYTLTGLAYDGAGRPHGRAHAISRPDRHGASGTACEFAAVEPRLFGRFLVLTCDDLALDVPAGELPFSVAAQLDERRLRVCRRCVRALGL